MTKAQYQANRIAQGSSLLAALHALIKQHCTERGLEPAAALTGALTDMRHLADIHGLDFGELDARAYECFLEESQAGREQS